MNKIYKKEEKLFNPNYQILATTIDCSKYSFYQGQLRNVVLKLLQQAHLH